MDEPFAVTPFVSAATIEPFVPDDCMRIVPARDHVGIEKVCVARCPPNQRICEVFVVPASVSEGNETVALAPVHTPAKLGRFVAL